MPIDMVDFWSRETMGVAVKPYNCETDKLSLIERKEAEVIEDSCQKISNHWLVPYPWERDLKELPNNKVQAGSNRAPPFKNTRTCSCL